MNGRDRKWWITTLCLWALGAVVGCLVGLVSVARSSEPVPQFVPVPHFTPIPNFSPTPACKSQGGVCKIKVPVTAEVRKEPVKKVLEKTWGIVGWSRACPSCPLQPTYGWIDQEVEASEPTVAEAATELSKGGLSKEREKKLSDIIDAPWKEKARKRHLSPGSCGMLGCPTHPGHEVFDDEESQEETDAKTVPWGNEGGRFRHFRGRR